MADMNKWQSSFARSMENVRSHWVKRFEDSVGKHVGPAFEEIAAFVSKHGIKAAAPLKQSDRRSFKFEIAENAYALVSFRHVGMDDVQMTCEYFVPGGDPGSYDTRVSCVDVTREWATAQFQEALDSLVNALNNGEGSAGGKSADLELIST